MLVAVKLVRIVYNSWSWVQVTRCQNLFFISYFFYAHLLRPLILKQVVLIRDSTRPDLPRYTVKFNDFYVVFNGIERPFLCTKTDEGDRFLLYLEVNHKQIVYGMF